MLELSVSTFIGKYNLVLKKASSAVLLDSTVFSFRGDVLGTLTAATTMFLIFSFVVDEPLISTV